MDHQSIITPRDLERMLSDETAEPKALPLSLLNEITHGFSAEQKIGSGGYAVVYKGKLEKRNVAVKRLSNAYMYEKEFQREVECLMIVKHKNVVRFLGYCADTQGNAARHDGKFVLADVQQRLLCFEYLPNGSLYEYITDISHQRRWRDRYQIIKGICQGLHYLHQNNIVHLDLKPENILLDDNWEPKITDFGISRCFDEIQSHVITKLFGTPGYLAPECFNYTKVTDLNPYRLDIYSLGAVIVEIVTGKKACDDVDKVVESWIDKLEESQSEVQLKQIRLCVEIGLECTNFDPARRPVTRHILSRLDGTTSMYGYIKAGMTTSQQVTDSPSKKAKQYASSGNKERSAPIKPGSVQLVIKNNTVSPLSENKQKVMIELTGGDYTSDRPGLDLVAVVDVSHSMQNEKIEQLKTALRFLVQKLSTMDRLSVITFTYGAKELWPLRYITEASQRELEHIIAKFDLWGNANIAKGLQARLNVLADRDVRVGRVAGIMLVSCGQKGYQLDDWVNVGDVPVYTFCFGGTDSHPKLLDMVAGNSMGGTFYHVLVQDTGGLTMAFSQCLAGLLTVAVQNLELTVAAVSGESNIVKVNAGSYTQEQQKDESVTAKFGNLYSTEVRKVIVELHLPTIHSDRSAEILDVSYSHSRSAGRMKFVGPTETLTVGRTSVNFLEERPAVLLMEEARLQVVEMIKMARVMAVCNRMGHAQDKLMEAQTMLTEQQSNSSFLMMAELQELLELFKTEDTYETEGKHYAMSLVTSHSRQRSSGRGGSIEVMRLFATPRMEKYLEEAKKFLNEPTMQLPSLDDDVKDDVGTVTVNDASRGEEMRRGQPSPPRQGSVEVTDSPSKQDKQYESSEAGPTPIKPGSVQLVLKNNTVAPLLEHKQKVMLELTGGGYTSDRLGLDLVAVLDVSEYMLGDKIDQVKTAMVFLVQKLSPMDRLSVITFVYQAEELWPLRQITEASQRELVDIISKLKPSGSLTELRDGIQAGVNVLADREVSVGRVAGIMLVSFGKLSYGYPNPVDVGDVPVYTFCFSEKRRRAMVLHQVAAKSMGGTFSHVVSDYTGGLTMAFSQCLAGLLTVAVQNLELTVAAVRGESKIVKVTAGSYPQEQQKDESITVKFGNLYSTEVRKTLVELLLPTIHSHRSVEILNVSYSHSRSAGKMKFVAPDTMLTVQRTGAEFSHEEKTAGLLSEEARLHMVQMIEEARTIADYSKVNDMDDAQDKLVEAENMPEVQSNSYLRTELQKLMEHFKTRETYEKRGLPYALSLESSHGRQHFAGTGTDIEVMRLFATPLMDKYLKQARKFLNEPMKPLPSVDDDVKEEVSDLTVDVPSRKEEMQRLALDVVFVRKEPSRMD